MVTMRTGRPPKDENQRLTVPLRLMVTTTQKNVVDEALRLDGSEFSEWARTILLDAAKRMIAQSKKGASERG
jgi:hypothetical protein